MPIPVTEGRTAHHPWWRRRLRVNRNDDGSPCGGNGHQADRDAVAPGHVVVPPRPGSVGAAVGGGVVKALRLLRAPLVASASVALVVTLGVPASAGHVTLEVDWTAPGDDPEPGVIVDGTVGVDADVSFDSGLVNSNVKEWQAQLRSDDDSTVGVLCSRGYSDLGTGTATVDFTFDSRYVPSGTINTECEEGDSANADTTRRLMNGRYVLRLRAHDQVLTSEWHAEDFAIRVNNPPSTPQDVTATFDEAQQQVQVTWTENPEIDLYGYLVQQCHTESASKTCGSSDWQTVAENGSDDVDVDVAVSETGAYRYRVIAQRPDWSQNAILSSVAGKAGTPIVLEDENADPEDPDAGDPSSDPEQAGDEAPTTLPEHTTNPDQDRGSSGGTERRRSLEPRLVQRDAFDVGGFDEALPYGAQPVDDTPPRADGLLISQEGAGNAMVPIAGGLVVFVFSMQLRYLGRRASLVAAGAGGAVAIGDDEWGPSDDADDGDRVDHHPDPDPDEHDEGPAFRPLLGGSADGPGSFISNWKRWVPKGS